MIAKIGKGENLYGALSYNQLKVDAENGAILFLNRIPETLDNRYSAAYFHQCFEPYLSANIKTEKHVRHISLNPDPRNKVSDEQFAEMAQLYMKEMGYANQPYIVFKHNDIERTHIHIVTSCVDLQGKKISDAYDHPRSMAICRNLEKTYNLIPATEKTLNSKEEIFRPIDYKNANVKSQIASVVRHLPKYYQYQSLGAYNALLSLFNITAEEVKGELHGQPRQGLVYFALNEQKKKVTNPFKASRFGKQAGLETLQKHFEQSKEKMKVEPAKEVLKKTIEVAIHMTTNETEFKKQLLEQGINTIIRRNDEGRIYGITFIDHQSRTVWNGSQLGKSFSANIFNDCWKQTASQKRQNNIQDDKTVLSFKDEKKTKIETEKPHALFDFLDGKQSIQTATDFELIESLGGILPEAQGEDYEEQVFANQMKKKKNHRKHGNQK